jgi:hypothetical protein
MAPDWPGWECRYLPPGEAGGAGARERPAAAVDTAWETQGNQITECPARSRV